MMKEKLSSMMAVIAGAAVTTLGTFKCCLLPAALSTLGLAGTTASLLVRWLSPALVILSVALLARSHYALYVQHRGNRTSEITTWAATVLVMIFWTLHLLNGLRA